MSVRKKVELAYDAVAQKLKFSRDGGRHWRDLSSGGSVIDIGAAANSYQVCAGYRGILPTEALWNYQQFADFDCDGGNDVFGPWFLPVGIEVAEFAWKINTPAVGLYRYGLYAADSGWQPSELLWDSGQQDASDDTQQTDSVALTLPAGRYLQAICCDADAIANAVLVTAFNFESYAGIDTGVPELGVDNGPGIFYRVRAFGAFPNPGDPWTVQGPFGGNCNFPLFCRIA